MDCCEFREKYSDFADGLLAEAEERRARRHLGDCASCYRFNEAFRAGVDALRRLPPVGVSHGFSQRLRQRLRLELAVRAPGVDQWAGAVGALLVVATVGVVAWDLAEMRAPGRPRVRPTAVVSRVAPPAIAPRAAELVPRRDSAQMLRDPFHPLHPIMVVADTHAALYTDHLRFDVPAVWGGR